MKKVEFRIDKEGVARTDSKEHLAGKVLCELSGQEDFCSGECCDEAPITDDQEIIHHIDGDPGNNAPENLSIVKARDNIREKTAKEPIRIRITKEGAAYPEWWTEQSSEILCSLCGKDREQCLTESKGGMFLSCPNIQSTCG